MQTITVQPVNSILFLEDMEGGDIPTFTRDEAHLMVWATPSCVCFRVFPEIDGPTEITIGRRVEVDPGRPQKFIGDLATPSRRVRLVQVGEEVVFEMSVGETKTKVSIWLSHPKWPEQVIVGLE